MIIINFFIKNEARVVAKEIANIFKRVNGEYDVAYATITNHWFKYDKSVRNLEPLLMAANNQLPNLSMLAVAEINALRAKRNTPLSKSFDTFHKEIVRYLSKQGIAQHYIVGENFEASKKAAEIIKTKLHEKGIET
ncbi:MAG: hypothetical protein Q4G44_06610 [Alcaligenaceae bacterium]|nr:hypothetical protein [Alcaligenaceae bacterium]